MLHLVQCRHTKPLWKKCLQFCHEVLQAPDMIDKLERAIIFNQDQKKDMLPEAACAFIRHVFNILYHDFANVEKGHIFVWQKVYYRALTSFRRAAMRYAGKIRLQHTHRIYTDLTAEVSEESRKKFEQIIEIDTTGVSGLMPDFKGAITAALTSLKAVSDADMRSLATAQKLTNNNITRGEQDEYDPRSTRDRPEIDPRSTRDRHEIEQKVDPRRPLWGGD